MKLQPTTRNLLKIATAAAIHFACGRLGYVFSREGEAFTAFWPASGTAIFLLFLWGRVALSGIVLGAILLQVSVGTPLWMAVCMSPADISDSAVPYYLMRRFGASTRLFTVRDIIMFCLAALVGSLGSALVGNMVLGWGGAQPWSSFAGNMTNWWAANFAGGLIVTPLLISYWRESGFAQRRMVELILLIGTMLLVSFYIFVHENNRLLEEMEYLILPLAAWGALRFGILGVSWTWAIISVMAITGTLAGSGVFRHESLDNSIFLTQAFLCVTSITAHLLAASLYERQSAEKALRESHERLEARVEERTKELKEIALHDTLTNLPNRRWMLDHLRYALGRAKRDETYRFGLLFLDLDRFKVVNDSLGHQAGDCLLVTVADRLKGTIRDGDAVARLGGDEFTVFVNDFHPEGSTVMHVAERIQEVLQEHVDLDGRTIHMTASIGIALSITGYDTPEDMLRDADTAMYRAKHENTTRIQMFDPGMHVSAMARLVLESDLRRAMLDNQFFLMYQPIVLCNSGRLVGFEALLRWKHPQRGLISPVEFIPVAEEMRLMVPIGNWVLEQACSFLSRWREEYAAAQDLVISVNISAMQFREPNLAAHVSHILSKTGLPGKCLKLELTESMLIQNTDQLTATLDSLRSFGTEVMIDDFGTGFSSLSYLAHLPIDALKIDRSFVSGEQQTKESIEIVRCIVAMAKALGISTVAEGVETAEQADWLCTMECEYAQGYHFSKPLEADAAKERLVASIAAGLAKNQETS